MPTRSTIYTQRQPRRQPARVMMPSACFILPLAPHNAVGPRHTTVGLLHPTVGLLHPTVRPARQSKLQQSPGPSPSPAR